LSAYLLDVNVLLALFDTAHLHHEAAHSWFSGHRGEGWATCPITENGFVRVISSPAYPTVKTTPAEAIRRLREFTRSGGHGFWPDDLSLLQEGLLKDGCVFGPRQITDLYLLALAQVHGGRLATFDGRMQGDLLDSGSDHLVLIPS